MGTYACSSYLYKYLFVCTFMKFYMSLASPAAALPRTAHSKGIISLETTSEALKRVLSYSVDEAVAYIRGHTNCSS